MSFKTNAIQNLFPRLSLLAVMVSVLTACGEKPPTCSDQQNITVLKRMFYEELLPINTQQAMEINWVEIFKQSTNIDSSTIRTTGLDEKIGKVTCSATLTTTFPESLQTVLSNGVLMNLTESQDKRFVKINGLTASTDIRYSVQQSDDKKTLRVEVEGFQGILAMVSAAKRSALFIKPTTPINNSTPAVTETVSTTAPQAVRGAQVTTDGIASPNLARYAGKSTFDLLADVSVTVKLKELLGKDYAAFNERMGVSGEVRQEAGYLWGTGLMPHEGGSEEAGFAVNIKTGEVVALMLVGGKQYKFFGVSKPAGLPQPLLDWYKQRNETQ